jgi:hypothetical protein
VLRFGVVDLGRARRFDRERRRTRRRGRARRFAVGSPRRGSRGAGQGRERRREEIKSELAAAAMPAADRARFEGWWAMFVRADQGWPAARSSWRALPAPAPHLLAENMLRRHVLAFDAGNRTEYERTKHELVLMADVSTPLLVGGLARAAGDTLVRQHAADLLGAIGPTAAPEIERALGEASPKGRRDLVRALARMRNPATTPALARIARGGESFETRIEAVKGLSENGDAKGYETVVACLEDGDPSVRKFAARYIGAYRRADTPRYLVACMERCERERDAEGVAETHAALKALTKLDPPAESGAWKAVLRRAGGLGTEGR